MHKATAALNAGAYSELQELCKQILNIDRKQADAWFFMSIVAEVGRQPGHALQFIDRALQINSVHCEYLTQKAKLHSLLNQFLEADESSQKAINLKPDRAIVLDTLGVTLTRLGRHAEACKLLRQAVDKEPEHPQYQFNLGSAEQFLGHDQAAREAYQQAIALKPDFSRAYWALSELEKNQPEPGRLEHLLELHNSPGCKTMDRLYLAHAIARDYERQGDFDKAFNFLKSAKQQRKQEISYSINTDIQLFEKLTAVFDRTTISPASNDALDGKAIFIVGMPRSGTTLLERILSSHSNVESFGELQDFPRAVKQVSGVRSPVVLDEETITAAAQEPMDKLGAAYAKMLAHRTSEGLRFIDKLPLNFYYVGFVMAALPQAKVICVRRNPLDTILSNYRQLFALSFSYYNYHFDLADTARFFVQFDRLMSFWQVKFGERFYQMDYEFLVSDPEPTVREVFNYLDLGWEPECLQFHKHKGAVATASAAQVRQPLYSSAVARWRKYEKNLAPAIEVLEKAGIAYR